eukprot:XP_008657258.1 pectinesterase inhibitor 10-like [Zea mays]
MPAGGPRVTSSDATGRSPSVRRITVAGSSTTCIDDRVVIILFVGRLQPYVGASTAERSVLPLFSHSHSISLSSSSPSPRTPCRLPRASSPPRASPPPHAVISFSRAASRLLPAPPPASSPCRRLPRAPPPPPPSTAASSAGAPSVGHPLSLVIKALENSPCRGGAAKFFG